MEIYIRFYIEYHPECAISQAIDVSPKIDASQLSRILASKWVDLFDGNEYIRDVGRGEKLIDILKSYPKGGSYQFSVGTIDIERASETFPNLLEGYRRLKKEFQ